MEAEWGAWGWNLDRPGSLTSSDAIPSRLGGDSEDMRQIVLLFKMRSTMKGIVSRNCRWNDTQYFRCGVDGVDATLHNLCPKFPNLRE